MRVNWYDASYILKCFIHLLFGLSWQSTENSHPCAQTMLPTGTHSWITSLTPHGDCCSSAENLFSVGSILGPAWYKSMYNFPCFFLTRMNSIKSEPIANTSLCTFMCIFNANGSLWVTSTSWLVADLYRQFKLQ